MPSWRLLKGEGNRSLHSGTTMRNCRPRALMHRQDLDRLVRSAPVGSAARMKKR
jgi:hypothetical protein